MPSVGAGTPQLFVQQRFKLVVGVRSRVDRERREPVARCSDQPGRLDDLGARPVCDRDGLLPHRRMVERLMWPYRIQRMLPGANFGPARSTTLCEPDQWLA
jgi:hypothetical protein